MALVVPSKSRSEIRVILMVRSWCLETKVLSIKQCVEPESTKVTMVTEGIKLEVSYMVKEFGLERMYALRHSSTVTPIRSMQPWSRAGAGGLLPNFLTPWQQSRMHPGWQSCASLCSGRFIAVLGHVTGFCRRIDRDFGPCDVVFLAA